VLVLIECVMQQLVLWLSEQASAALAALGVAVPRDKK
jgi:hypothetical protein